MPETGTLGTKPETVALGTKLETDALGTKPETGALGTKPKTGALSHEWAHLKAFGAFSLGYLLNKAQRPTMRHQAFFGISS